MLKNFPCALMVCWKIFLVLLLYAEKTSKKGFSFTFVCQKTTVLSKIKKPAISQDLSFFTFLYALFGALSLQSSYTKNDNKIKYCNSPGTGIEAAKNEY